MRNGCIMVRYIVTLSFVKLPCIEFFEILAVRLAVEVEAAQQWRFKQWRYKQGDDHEILQIRFGMRDNMYQFINY